MKRQSNIIVSAALITTLAVMAACAPKEKRASFKHRGGIKADSVEGKTGIRRDMSPENNEFSATILAIHASVADTAGNAKGQSQSTDELKSEILSDKDAQTVEAQNSEASGNKATVALLKTDEKKNGLAAERGAKIKTVNQREQYGIKAAIVVSGLGQVTFAGTSKFYGNHEAFMDLEAEDKACDKKLGLIVSAVCRNENCSELLVQVSKNKENSDSKLHIEEMLRQISKSPRDNYKLIRYGTVERVSSLVAKDADAQKDAAEQLKAIASQKANCSADKAANDNEPAEKAQPETAEPAKEVKNPADSSSASTDDKSISEMVTDLFGGN